MKFYDYNPVICLNCNRLRPDSYVDKKCDCEEGEYVPYEEQDLLELEEPSSCDCKICRSYCNRPCWPTPAEAEQLMDAGFAHKLMLDYWASDELFPRTEILSPAIEGYEGEAAPWWPSGKCTFHTEGLCELHGAYKPLEGRLAHHAETPRALHYEMVRTWATPEGRLVVDRWKRII